MQINRNNYEEYFLDYWENNLNESVRICLDRFLDENPDLQDKFYSFENIILKPDTNIFFENKSALKKNVVVPVSSVNESNYEHFFIAELEGELTVGESEKLKLFLKRNPFLEKEFELYKKSYLKPDTDITFPDKEHLKKKTILPVSQWIYYSVASAAAAILLLFYILGPENRSSHDFSIDLFPQKRALVNFGIHRNKISDEQDLHNRKTEIVENIDEVSGIKTLPPVAETVTEIVASENTAETGKPAELLPEHIQRLEIIDMPDNILTEKYISVDLIYRSEYSAHFLNTEFAVSYAETETRKSRKLTNALGKALAVIGNLLTGKNKENNMNTIWDNVALYGKIKIAELSDNVPFFYANVESKNKTTYFALGDQVSVSRKITSKNAVPKK